MKNSNMIRGLQRVGFCAFLLSMFSGCADVGFRLAQSDSTSNACGEAFTLAVQRGARLGPAVSGAAIPGEYLIASRSVGSFRRGGVGISATSMASQIATLDGVSVRQVFEGNRPRLLVRMNEDRARAFAKDDSLYVEPNRVVTISSDTDLLITGFKSSATVVAPGSAISFEVGVRNTGSVSTGSIALALQVTDDKKATVRNVCKVIEVPANGDMAVGFDVSMPATLGRYEVKGRVDDSSLVLETDEQNNTFGPLSLTIAPQGAAESSPDLIVSLEPGAFNPTANTTFAVQVKVSNQGKVASGATQVALFKDAPGEPGPDVEPDALVAIPALAAGATHAAVANLSFVAVGSSQIRAIVDRSNAILESNEGNNQAGPTPLKVVLQVVPTGVLRMGGHLSSTRAGDSTGSVDNITVAIVDSGVDVKYTDELNVVGGRDFVALIGGSINDDNGHGTHVAGTVGAKDNEIGVVGVAPGVKLVAARVVDSSGSGTTAGVIAGLAYSCSGAVGAKVVNMSLGGGDSELLKQAVRDCVASGITVVVSAGNDNQDASTQSPANEAMAITVAALTDTDGLSGGLGGASASAGPDDTFALFSNFGAVVDVIAPGVRILSTKMGGGTAMMSGTSMASPHVAGLAALYLSKNPTATPAQVSAALIAAATTSVPRGTTGRVYPLVNAQGF